jgi:hypothetical protein
LPYPHQPIRPISVGSVYAQYFAVQIFPTAPVVMAPETGPAGEDAIVASSLLSCSLAGRCNLPPDRTRRMSGSTSTTERVDEGRTGAGVRQYVTARLPALRRVAYQLTGDAHRGDDGVQQADRWHLWRNLGDAVETVVVAHRADLAEPITEPEQPVPHPAPDPTQPSTEQAETGLATRTRECFAAIQELLTAGVSRAGVSRQLQLDPHTVRRFAEATTIDELLVNTRRDSLIDDYRPYLHQRWNEGCTDATTLYQEIRQLGFTGSDKTVRRYVQPFRATIVAPLVAPAPPKTPPRRPLDHD